MSDLARVRVHGNQGMLALVIAGEIDISNVSDVREAIDSKIAEATVLTIDLCATTFLDSSAIAMLLAVADRLRTTRRKMYIVIPDDAPIRRLAKLSGLDAQVPVLSSADEVSKSDPEGNQTAP